MAGLADAATVLLLGGACILVFCALGGLWDWYADRREFRRQCRAQLRRVARYRATKA